MKKLLLFLVFTNLFANNLDELKNKIKTNNISSDFIQHKKLKDFDLDIISKGNIKIKNEELFYTLKEPFYQEILINKNGVFNKENGVWQTTQSQIDKEIFLDLLKLNFDKLKNKFSYEIVKDGELITITLIPNNLIISKIFTKIVIVVEDKIKSILVLEKNGDTTLNEYF